MERTFNIIIEKGESGYYISEVIGLPWCHTQATTIDELINRTKEAILLYLEVNQEALYPTTQFLELQQIKVTA